MTKKIKDIEEWADENRIMFNDCEPEKGHMDRFLAKIGTQDEQEPEVDEQKPLRTIHFQRTPRRKTAFWKVITFPLAATLLLYWGMNIFIKYSTANSTGIGTDYFASVKNSNNPEEIYDKYSQTVSEYIDKIADKTAMMTDEQSSQIFSTVNSIIDEPVSIEEMLPEEISDGERAAILRHYYSRKIDGVKQIYHSYLDNKKSIFK